MCNVTHIVHIAQGVSVPVHELHTIFLSTHVWNGSICIFIGLCTCFWCGACLTMPVILWDHHHRTRLHRPIPSAPRQTSNLSLRQRSQAMSGCQTFRCLSSNWTNSSDSHSANTSYNTTLKNTLESKWTKTCKDEDKGKKPKHGESPAMLAEWKQSPNWGKHIGHSWKAKLSKLSKCIIVLTSETTRTRASVCILISSQLILRPLRIRCTAIAFCNSSQTACSAKQLR